MDPRIANELRSKQPTPFHKALLEHCKSLVEMSRSDMSKYYDKWEKGDLVYRGERYADEEDKKACKQGAPNKIVVPLTYAQVQTFIAFAMGLLQQREHFYELEGTGEEDHRGAKLGEGLLDQNLEQNQFTLLLYQFLLDIGRFSLGVYKHSWVKETESVWTEQEVPVSPTWNQPMQLLGQLFSPAPRTEKRQVKQEQVAYMGNRIEVISPFCFFPDTRFPLCKFQEGEFCADESEVSRSTLRKREADGMYAGTEHITKLGPGAMKNRRAKTFSHTRTESVTARGQIESTVIVTSVQIELTPSKFKLSDGKPMGTSNVPEKWIVDYGNDERIIRAEPYGYVHNNFTYRLGQFSPDQEQLINETISDMVGHLQAVIDWLVNSHITNVRKHISNRLVIDPAGVMFEDLRDHKPVIRLKAAAANGDVNRYIKQLSVSDVTRGHIGDVQTLIQFVTMTTAISDNLMGQYHTGRRSAREAGNTASATGTRLRTVVKLLFDGCLKPMGRDMLSNLRDGLDEEMFVTLQGDEFPDWDAYTHFKLPDGRMKVKVNRTNINGRYDFKVFEGILPSDKAMQAETLEQTLLTLMKNPQGLGILVQVLGYDPKKLFKEVLELRGVKHSDRFKIDQVRAQELMAIQQQQQIQENGLTNTNPGQPGQPTGQPVATGAVQGPPGAFESLLAGG